MNKKRITLIIATTLALLISFPRVMVLLNGGVDPSMNTIVEVTLTDTILRALLFFSFSYVTLKFNLIWIQNIAQVKRKWALPVINAIILLFWLLLFLIINRFFYPINDSVLSPSVNAIVYFFFLVLLALIGYALRLVDDARSDKLEKEQLKRKSVQNELEALKNQINPHFLFNSLNTLSLLVREDQKAANKFINKLSFLFRYTLQSKDKELVTVSEELKFLDSYVHLNMQRYQENFNVSIDIGNHIKDKKIPILALQMLLENAIKHNEISSNKPLHIDVYDENNWIVVKNNLQERTGHIDSTNTGLKNLNARAKLLVHKEIQIIKNSAHFIVKIPTA